MSFILGDVRFFWRGTQGLLRSFLLVLGCVFRGDRVLLGGDRFCSCSRRVGWAFYLINRICLLFFLGEIFHLDLKNSGSVVKWSSVCLLFLLIPNKIMIKKINKDEFFKIKVKDFKILGDISKILKIMKKYFNFCLFFYKKLIFNQ